MAVDERRLRRREAVMGDIVDAAWAQAAQVGVGQISLRRLAEDVGMRAPSLYEYFPSKLALYDALFASAALEYRDRARSIIDKTPARQALFAMGELFLRFALEHPAKYQLVFQRPVPDFVPSAESFAISQEMEQDFIAAVASLVEAGEAGPRLLEPASLDLLTAITSGLAAQQIANEPEASFEEGRWSTLLPMVDEMIRGFFSPQEAKPKQKRRSS